MKTHAGYYAKLLLQCLQMNFKEDSKISKTSRCVYINVIWKTGHSLFIYRSISLMSLQNYYEYFPLFSCQWLVFIITTKEPSRIYCVGFINF